MYANVTQISSVYILDPFKKKSDIEVLLPSMLLLCCRETEMAKLAYLCLRVRSELVHLILRRPGSLGRKKRTLE